MTVSVPVAQYLRMSSDHQNYSLDNQRQAIQAYSDLHNFSVILTYTDNAKSGLMLTRRTGLQQLLKDVVSGTFACKAILVYDISRWGRFQDADESAHYEFLCKSAGIPVHYCAETFVNDGTPPSMIMKALKRTMAGEYSRELSVKVLAGLRRLAKLGFKQGGCPGYGLRRMLISAERKPKQQLARGERKSIATDRVILALGPSEEVECVREIYRMFNELGFSVYGIARELNRQGINYIGTSKWDYMAIYGILTHPKYVGCHVFGRTSRRLGTAAIGIPTSEWIFAPTAFAPLVDQATFQKAQHQLLARTINKSNEELLDSLHSLLRHEGRLTLQLIKNSPKMPSPSAYRDRFGSLRQAYKLIGYNNPGVFGPIDLRRRTQALREGLIDKIHAMFPREVSIWRRGERWRSRLKLNTGVMVTVLVSRCIGTDTTNFRWQVDPVLRERRLVTVLALLDDTNNAINNIYIFPCMHRKGRFVVRVHSAWLRSGERLDCLSRFLEAVSNVALKRKVLDRCATA